MSTAEFIDTFIQYGVFALMFFWLFLDTRKETKAREERLLGQVDKLNDSFLQIAKILDNVEQRLSMIEDRQLDDKE